MTHLSIEASLWNVEFSTDPTEKRKWRQNHILGVVSETLDRAIEIVREAHPDARIHAVHKKSPNNTVLVDKSLVQ